MNSRHRKTWDAIFEDPLRSDVRWDDIEAMLRNIGASIRAGNGSRRRIELLGVKAVFPRPHPEPETDKGALQSLQAFLKNSGFNPNERK